MALMTWPDPRFTAQRSEQLQAEALAAERDPFLGLLAQAKLLGSTGRKQEAQEVLRQGETLFPADVIPDGQFRNLLPAAILVGGAGLAHAWYSKRFRPAYAIDFEIVPSDTAFDIVHLTVRGNLGKFAFPAGLFQSPSVEPILNRWVDIFPLFDKFMTSPHRLDGGVDISLGDAGLRPGLAFCANKPGYFLIPDSAYLDQNRYQAMRDWFRNNNVAWADRRQAAFWRGTTSGTPMDPDLGWHSLPRIRLCEIGTRHPDVLDVGITGLTQIEDPGAMQWLTGRNMLRAHVPSEYFNKYRYQIDIDGNSNAWAGLFIKLLTGSPVLKVNSPEGYRQWFYDRLRPWINFIPVATDMTDLVEKVEWLRAHDDVAREIGEAGYQLANELTGEQEITAAAPVFAAAIRTAARAPSVDLRFGADSPDHHAARTGWLPPNEDGLPATGFEARLELAKPYGLGDFILIVEISPVAPQPRRVTIVANGQVIAHRSLRERTTIYCPLPNRLAGAGATLQLCFCLPDSRPNAGQANPLDTRMLSVTLHRVTVATASCYTGDGHPEVAEALAALRGVSRESKPHDLWGPVRSLPPREQPLTVRTFLETIVFADLRSGRLRHAPREVAPRNVVLVAGGAGAALMRINTEGSLREVRLRPEGPHAAEAVPAALAPNGSVATLEIAATEDTDRREYFIRGAGLYLCAEPDGQMTLSRVQGGPWERFRFEASLTPQP
jgi:Glycosyl transferase family 90